MKGPLVLTAFVVCLLGTTAALDRLVIKGSKFFNSRTGEQFYFKGIAYQPQDEDNSTRDPLADTEACHRDIKVFKDLGLNSIRVYDVNYENNHEECMRALEEAGIYLFLDIPNSTNAINRADPTWDLDLFNHYKNKIDAFAEHSNIAAFLIGNEVTNSISTTPSSAYVKAATRDIKAYIRSLGKEIPVGYADNDDPAVAKNLVPFFVCGDDPLAQIDFYAINTYRWCGKEATFQTSGYSILTEKFRNFSMPVLLSEYGCNIVRPRTFSEVRSIFGPDMQDVFSGGFMYEYSQETNDYGIVKIPGSGDSVTRYIDFDDFRREIRNASPKGVNFEHYNPAKSVQRCPAVSEEWQTSSKALPPTPNEQACQCMFNSLECALSSDYSDSEGKILGDFLGYVCGENPDACAEVSGFTKTGQYGIYSGCSAQQRSSYIINANYLAQNRNRNACKIDGVSAKIKPRSSAAVQRKCENFASTSAMKPHDFTDTKGHVGRNSNSISSKDFGALAKYKNSDNDMDSMSDSQSGTAESIRAMFLLTTIISACLAWYSL
ncbi:1 3-beta-glucanosyltransferase gel4 [Mycoemilia scoparia]|uniref:1,3-beta-glucanosyltransferase n=1 Tax=Mycoemilia scoparia TaxID=417184 RepID=A0A9W8DTY3_9FUNG|nr:1 3-beta-glucanosyltransferase gel4 [Mycoemilia scoparia]